jgi:excisionase family DNA binding protein
MNDITSYEFITVDELAGTLQISRTSAYALLKNGAIKSFKIGAHYKIPATAVDEYIKRMTGLPIPTAAICLPMCM